MINNLIGGVTVIDGVTNNSANIPVAIVSQLAVNTLTNKIYAAAGNSVLVIDGVTNHVATLATGSGLMLVAVNQVTNQIYAADVNSNVTVIDGISSSVMTVSPGLPACIGGSPASIAVNPVTNRVYFNSGCSGSDNLSVIEEPPVQSIPLTTSIAPLQNNETSNLNFTFTANSSTVTVPDGVYFQADTWQNTWTRAAGSNPTFTGTVAGLQPGLHILYAYAGDGQEATSTQAYSPLIGTIQAYPFVVTPAVEQYSGLDTITQGNWNGQYGGDGYLIANAGSRIPVYANVSIEGVSTYTWLSKHPTCAPCKLHPALSRASLPPTMPTASIDVNITDAQTHRVALYLLDWENSGRAENIKLLDATTLALLDSQNFSSFHNGLYAAWNLNRNVIIRITGTSGNAVVSGIFFGPAGVPSGPPSLASSAT